MAEVNGCLATTGRADLMGQVPPILCSQAGSAIMGPIFAGTDLRLAHT